MTRSRIGVRLLSIAAALTCCVSLSAWAETQSFVGVWKGISVCQIKDSPCRDEGAVYTVKKGTAADSFEVSGNKVVDGRETFMGLLQCRLGSQSDSLICQQGEDAVWMWKLQGDSMSGTLTYRGQLFRKISLTRAK